MANPQDEEFILNNQLKIEDMSAKLNQPHRFAKIFCEAAESQMSINDAFQKIINRLIKTDPEIRSTLEEHQKQINKNDLLYGIMKGLGFFKQILMLFIAAAIGFYFKKYF